MNSRTASGCARVFPNRSAGPIPLRFRPRSKASAPTGAPSPGGNPNLKARDARNYDFSLEYYFPKGDGIASVAVFQKDIADDIFNLSTTETVNGTLITTTQPTNALSSRIRGLELALVRNHLPWVATLLPGLGFTGNLTLFDTAFNYVDARGLRYSGSRLPLQSKWSANAALAYEWKGRAEVRVAYDYRSQYTSTFNATQPWNSEGWGNYGQWDFNARWRATKRWHADFSIPAISATPTGSIFADSISPSCTKMWISAAATGWV